MTTPTSIRPAAVAGLFYADEPAALRHSVQALLAENPSSGPPPRAVIAPHAGYIYSGPVAARAYN
ncbi:MAG: AmmeMemoRadiSam system protein B, partial [Gammaproteobacteria bacterium]